MSYKDFVHDIKAIELSLSKIEKNLSHCEYNHKDLLTEVTFIRWTMDEIYKEVYQMYNQEKRRTDMRELKIGTAKYTQVFAVDEKDELNKANHQYQVNVSGQSNKILGNINFQHGAINEAGVNGVMNEDLIEMVIDRLTSCQERQFKGRENARAITKLEESLLWLRKRTMDREKRGIEGTHNI